MASKGKTAKPTASRDAAEQTRADENSKPKRKGIRHKGRCLPKTADRKGARKRGTYVPNYKYQIKIAERQDLARRLYEGGRTFVEISDHLKKLGYKASVGTVFDDVKDSIKCQIKSFDLSADELLRIELGTLQSLQATFFLEAKQHKDADAAKLVLQIMDRRDRYLNISKAQKADIDSKSALAKLFGVDPEDLPDDRESK